jgi:hypothetical protein
MTVSERSTGNLVLCLLAAALVGASFAVTWWEYDHSTGRRAPEGGFHDPSEDGVIRTHWDASPGSAEGDATPEHPAKAQRTLDQMAWALYAALGLLLLAALSELPGVSRILVRRVTLVLDALAFASVGVALWLTWFVLPEAFGNGMQGPFTSFLDDTGYTMTAITNGWAIAGASLAAILGGFLLKFQAGAPDPTVVAQLYAQGEL